MFEEKGSLTDTYLIEYDYFTGGNPNGKDGITPNANCTMAGVSQ
jgi:hypothetical protein